MHVRVVVVATSYDFARNATQRGADSPGLAWHACVRACVRARAAYSIPHGRAAHLVSNTPGVGQGPLSPFALPRPLPFCLPPDSSLRMTMRTYTMHVAHALSAHRPQ